MSFWEITLLCLIVDISSLRMLTMAFDKSDLYHKPIPPNMHHERTVVQGLRGQESFTNLTIDEIILKATPTEIRATGIMFHGDKVQAELDMILPRQQFYRLYGIDPNLQGAKRKKRKTLRDSSFRWPEGIVPYRIEPGHFDAHDLFWLNRSMSEWERYTCVKFVPVKKHHRNYVTFRAGKGCYADVGMTHGEHFVTLERPTCRWKAIYLHMIGHVLGLVHEHQVPKRDRYLLIKRANVHPFWRLWLRKYSQQTISRFQMRYDPMSIMHFGPRAFSKDGILPTMRLRKNRKSIPLGDVWRHELSFGDVKQVNILYKCSAKCREKVSCVKGGVVTRFCQCLCPDGTTDCQQGRNSTENEQNKNNTCKNAHNKDWVCAVWANQGECVRNPKWMKKNCQKACNMCSKRKAGFKLKTLGLALAIWNYEWDHTNKELCKDAMPKNKCSSWAARGDCITNTDWMEFYCRKTCEMCHDSADTKVACIDEHLDEGECHLWALDGECKKNTEWMLSNCKRSCRQCTEDDEKGIPPKTFNMTNVECEDKSDTDRCQQWVKRGECLNNEKWMTYNCRKACGRCNDGGCHNLYADEECEKWKVEMNECERRPSWMRKFCLLTCGHCKPGKGETTPSPYKKIQSPSSSSYIERYEDPHGSCRDKYGEEQCRTWAEAGHCYINTSFMASNCRKSCGICAEIENLNNQDECVDLVDTCPIWARGGYCEINPAIMLASCRKSCNNCFSDCTDSHSLCPMWSRHGYCITTPGPMYTHCRRSCGVC